jgi:hypothetical protein
MELPPGQMPYSVYGAPYYHYGAIQPNFGRHQLESTSGSSHSAASTSASMQHGEHQDSRADVDIGHRLPTLEDF